MSPESTGTHSDIVFSATHGNVFVGSAVIIHVQNHGLQIDSSLEDLNCLINGLLGYLIGLKGILDDEALRAVELNPFVF